MLAVVRLRLPRHHSRRDDAYALNSANSVLPIHKYVYQAVESKVMCERLVCNRSRNGVMHAYKGIFNGPGSRNYMISIAIVDRAEIGLLEGMSLRVKSLQMGVG